MNISADGYSAIFNHSPVAKLIISADAPHYTIIDVNQAYLNATNSKKEALIGKSVFTVFPKNPTDNDSKNIERTIHSFSETIKTRQPHTMENYRYDIPVPGTDQFIERYWTTVNTPILNDDGEVIFFIHSPNDVTEHYYLTQREKEGLQALKDQRTQLYSVFMQAPVGIGIFKGPENIVDLINPTLCQIYGKQLEEMLGQPVFDVLTQAKGQGFEEILAQVRTTGKTYLGKAVEVPLVKNGTLEKVFIDFTYVPHYNGGGSIDGVIAIAADVTEQVNSIHKLEETEERARLAADAVKLGIYDLNLVNSTLVTSKRFANIMGFEEPVSWDEYLRVLHPSDASVRQQAHERAIVHGKMMYEARVIMKDQTIHWVRVEGKVLYDKKRNPVRLLGTMLDITKQKSDSELQQKLITLVDHSVDLMSVLTLQGKITYINAAGVELMGFDSLEDALLAPISELYPEECYRFLRQEILPAVMETGSWAGTIKVRNNRTGEEFTVGNNYIRIDDALTNKPIAIGVVMHDLRPELKAKQALAESEHLLRNITSASPTALWMSDQFGKVNYVNQTWVDWSGNSFDENLGDGWLKVINSDDMPLVVEQFQEAISKQTLYEAEFRIHRSDGTQQWCVALGEPQYKKTGEFSGLIGSCTDITEHKELQTQKDNFIGIASHELKTPVTSLKGYTQVLQRILKKKGHQQEADMMQKMDTQLNRLTSLIGDLLDVTKINAGKLQINEKAFEVQPMIHALVEDLQRTTQKHTLIEEFKTNGKIFADQDRIEQVVVNLITNAIKYSPQADKVIIRCYETLNDLVVCVEDFGVGIAKDNQAKVFEQFYRVSGDMQHTFPGMGLGLYISSEIITRAGGKIWVESTENEGASFYFSLPLHQ